MTEYRTKEARHGDAGLSPAATSGRDTRPSEVLPASTAAGGGKAGRSRVRSRPAGQKRDSTIGERDSTGPFFGLYGGASLSLLPTNRLPPGAPFRAEATNPKQDDTSDKTPPCRPVPDPRAGRVVQPGLPGAANPHQRPCGRSGGRGHSLCQRRPAPRTRHAQHPLRMRYRPQRQLPSGGNSRRRLPAESLLHRLCARVVQAAGRRSRAAARSGAARGPDDPRGGRRPGQGEHSRNRPHDLYL